MHAAEDSTGIAAEDSTGIAAGDSTILTIIFIFVQVKALIFGRPPAMYEVWFVVGRAIIIEFADTPQLIYNVLVIATTDRVACYSTRDRYFPSWYQSGNDVIASTETGPRAVPVLCDVLTISEAFSHPTTDTSEVKKSRGI